MKKRFLACILALVLAISLVPTAFAATDEATEAAQALYEMGLFKGVGKDASGNPNFDLDRTPSRNEAVTMLVRLLGKEQEAKDGTWVTPFTDVTGWVKPYVGYAYEHGLTAGASSTTYGGDADVTVSQYLTFVLRALGYTSGTDFKWNAAWELSDKIGLTDGRYNASTTHFTRGDVAIISKQALSIKMKDSERTLQRYLGIGAVSATDNALNSYGARYLLMDGKYYQNLEFNYTMIQEVEMNGEKELFISFMGLGKILSIATDSYEIREGNSNPFISGSIETHYKADYTTDNVETVDWGGYSTESWYEYSSISESVYWRRYHYNGIELTMPAMDDPHEEGMLYVDNEIRCYNRTGGWGHTMVSVNDVFKVLGIEGTFSVTQIDDSTYAWSYTEK